MSEQTLEVGRDSTRQQDPCLRRRPHVCRGSLPHAALARRNEVLGEKAEAGYLTEDEAMALTHRLLRENAVRFFRLLPNLRKGCP